MKTSDKMKKELKNKINKITYNNQLDEYYHADPFIDNSIKQEIVILKKYLPQVEALEKALKEVINGGYCEHHDICKLENKCKLKYEYYNNCPVVKAKELL